MRSFLKYLLLPAILWMPAITFAQYVNLLTDVDSLAEFPYHIKAVGDSDLLIFGGGNSGYYSIGLRLNSQLQIVSKQAIPYGPTILSEGRNATMKELPDHHFVIAVPIYTPSTASLIYTYSMALVKLDSNGNTVALMRLTDTTVTKLEYAADFTIMPDGGFLVGGAGTSGTDTAKLIRTDSLGNVLWTRIYQSLPGRSCYFSSLELLPGGRILTGGAFINYKQEGQFAYYQQTPWFTIMDTAGNILKETIYSSHYSGSNLNSEGGNIATDKYGGYYQWGGLDSFFMPNPLDYPNLPAYVAHLDSNFQISWIRNFASEHHHVRILLMRQLTDSNYLAIGDIQQDGFTSLHGWACKLNKAGNVLWENYYSQDASWDVYFTDFIERKDKSLLITGMHRSNALPAWHQQDVYLVGIDSNGCNIPGCAVTSVPATLVKEKSLSIYPNPTQGQLTVVSALTGTVTISNLLGQQVSSYSINKGNTTISLPTGIQQGIYSAVFTTGDGVAETVRINYQP